MVLLIFQMNRLLNFDLIFKPFLREKFMPLPVAFISTIGTVLCCEKVHLEIFDMNKRLV